MDSDVVDEVTTESTDKKHNWSRTKVKLPASGGDSGGGDPPNAADQ